MTHSKKTNLPHVIKSAKRVTRTHSLAWRSIKGCLDEAGLPRVDKIRCVIANTDSRMGLPLLPSASIDCIITSPPYAGIKDYGTSGQIGFGQSREDEYLPDMESVFTELFRVAKPGATLWVVLDMIKESGEMVSLPWEVITRARQVGWTFHDIVIWDKGKSLPWSTPGRFRGVCEYILLLGKGKLACFNIDTVRDTDHLSSYWIKYPERYHPDGKAPSDLWHFPIPNQGSWAKGQSRHQCPFPVGLVGRMISISTKPGDIVLDPFSGTGSVAAVASHLGRHAIGMEINHSFVDEFDESGFDALVKRAQAEMPNTKTIGGSLREIIINLRMLKYCKTLFAGIARGDRLSGNARESIEAFFIPVAYQTKPSDTGQVVAKDLGHIKVQVLLRVEANKKVIEEEIQQRVGVAPLTLFGIQADVEVVPFDIWNQEGFMSPIPDSTWYIYRSGKFYHYDTEVNTEDLLDALRAESNHTRTKVPSIVSNIKIELKDPISD